MVQAATQTKSSAKRIFPSSPRCLRVENPSPTLNANQEMRVDREKKIIRRYVVAQEGLTKSADHAFDQKTLEQISAFINQKSAGIKSRFTHPTMSSDGLGKFLGRVKNAAVEEISVSPDGAPSIPKLTFAVRADLHFDKTALETPPGGGKPFGEYVMDLAESDPDALSSSIVTYDWDFEAQTDPETGKKMIDDDGCFTAPPFLRLNMIHASDIVDTGNAVDGLLASGELPEDMFLWEGAQILDRVFAGQPREVIDARIEAYKERYLDWRFSKNQSNYSQKNLTTLTGGKKMVDEKKQQLSDPPITEAQLREQLAAALEENKALREELDSKSDRLEKVEGAVDDLKVKLEEKDLKEWLNSRKMLKKVRQDERESILKFALSEKDLKRREEFKKTIESRADLLDPKEMAGDVENMLPTPPAIESRKDAVRAYAQEHKIDITNFEGLAEAEKGAKQANPELFGEVR